MEYSEETQSRCEWECVRWPESVRAAQNGQKPKIKLDDLLPYNFHKILKLK